PGYSDLVILDGVGLGVEDVVRLAEAHLDGWSLSSLCRYGHFRPRIDNGANRFDLRLIARASELHRLLLTKS
ncbi:hypothetical protein ACWEP2_34935, partial [Streptomyces sp. NPDC004279]